MQEVTVNKLLYTAEEMRSIGRAVEQSGRNAIANKWYAVAQGDKDEGVNLGAIYLFGQGIQKNLIIAATLFRTNIDGIDNRKDGVGYLMDMYRNNQIHFSSDSFETYLNDATEFHYSNFTDENIETFVEDYIERNIEDLDNEAEKKELRIKLIILKKQLAFTVEWKKDKDVVLDAMMHFPSSYSEFEFDYIFNHPIGKLNSKQKLDVCEGFFGIHSSNATHATKIHIIAELEKMLTTNEIEDAEQRKLAYEILYFFNKAIEGDTTAKTQYYQELFQDALNKALPANEKSDKEPEQKKRKKGEEQSDGESLERLGLFCENNREPLTVENGESLRIDAQTNPSKK